MTKVHILRLSQIMDKERFLLDMADEARRKKALRFVHLEDRLRCLAAGYLLKRRVPGYSEAALFVGKDGKPFLRNGPAFSLSHGGDFVVLAWDGEAEGVGVDVEPARDMEQYRPILPFFAKVGERSAIGEDPKKAVRIWTRKESLYKCVGEGVSDFLELPETLEDEVWFLGSLCRLKSWEEEGHMFSVALKGAPGPVELSEKEMVSLLQPCPNGLRYSADESIMC